MSIADFIAQGIGPSGDIPHFITVGLDIGEPPAVIDTGTPWYRQLLIEKEERTLLVKPEARNRL